MKHKFKVYCSVVPVNFATLFHVLSHCAAWYVYFRKFVVGLHLKCNWAIRLSGHCSRHSTSTTMSFVIYDFHDFVKERSKARKATRNKKSYASSRKLWRIWSTTCCCRRSGNSCSNVRQSISNMLCGVCRSGGGLLMLCTSC